MNKMRAIQYNDYVEMRNIDLNFLLKRNIIQYTTSQQIGSKSITDTIIN